MKSIKLKYKVLSVLLLVHILPSMLGVHIFQHHCFGCNQNELVTRMVATYHAHDHHCAACVCAEDTEPCCGASEDHACHSDESCRHEFKITEFEGKTAAHVFRFEAVDIELFYNSSLEGELHFFTNHQLIIPRNVIQYAVDDPVPERNCVFLL